MDITLNIFTADVVKNMRESEQYSASRTCLTVLRGLLNLTGNEELRLTDITPALLTLYQHHLLVNQRNRNTVSLYMRTLQSICNRATRNGLVELPADTFDNVFTGMEPVTRKAISPEMIRRIDAAEFAGKNEYLVRARDFFMLSIYLRGIAFIDLAYLRKCDFKDGYINFRRSKTGAPACVKVEPGALLIIQRYASEDPDSPYLLGIIRPQDTAAKERMKYESALRLYNKHLKRISEILKLGVKLTSYVARHSWATIAHDTGEDIADISAALCHSTEKMTRRYLQSFTPDRLAGVNRRVLQGILGYEVTATGIKRWEEKGGKKIRR